MNKKLVFLHIPKTAGQSVFQLLENTFENKMICPFRVDSQYDEVDFKPNDYQVHSGHIDWQRFEDCLEGEKVYFSVLRKPIDRILSYYFYLRKEALKIPSEELEQPNRAGMRAALKLSPDEYFVESSGELREFIDDHYDNFYLNYFSGKSYNARRFNKKIAKKDVLNKALKNISEIKGMYTLHNWENVVDLIEKEMGVEAVVANKQYVTNIGDGLSTEDRILKLVDLGATEKTISRIKEMCVYDDLIYEYVTLISSNLSE